MGKDLARIIKKGLLISLAAAGLVCLGQRRNTERDNYEKKMRNPDSFIPYVIQPGDSLSTIAEKACWCFPKDTGIYYRIYWMAYFSGKKDPLKVKQGDTLRIPFYEK